ncbi:Hypothetical predicted protein [Pelobates cultripes]|uniref:Uncharacterized protein n=1 Tax=Pelobates cultripes TaxID=61616 RepID=A0AAD1SW43_PELCU|nr:Hypothetical predicted protein [Pelobates cultripes]
MSQRQKSKAAKLERASFFLARTSALKAREGRSPSKDGDETCSKEGSLSPPASPGSVPDERPLTAATMRQMMAELSESMQADIEDKARRNNQRNRGIPETILAPALNDYLLDMFQALTPEIHPDQLLIDRSHRFRRPKHWQSSTARDIIVGVHFFHAKEKLVRYARTVQRY